MPNLIEQQDLLKGLPDQRLAMLLKNPVGDIPPFLVAAEAQRRESIRQQFSGQASNESVIDSLTRQLSKVPQNLNTQMQTPPQIPATPQMAGVAALQGMQNPSQQMSPQQPQQMRAGGQVRRFATGGFAARPSVESVAARVPTVTEVSGYYQDPFAIPDYESGPGIDFSLEDLGLPPLFPNYKTDEETKKKEQRGRIFPTLPPGSSAGMTYTPKPLDPGKADTSPENQNAEEASTTEDEYRDRIEQLYSDTEPSDWEKAQRWFAMSEQFLDPTKTTLQSVAGAGRAFSEASGGMAAAQRQADMDKEKALLEYDYREMQRQRDLASANATDTIESMKYQGEQAMKEAELYRKAADDAKSELADYTKNSMVPPEADDPRVIELQNRIAAANKMMEQSIRRSQYFQYQYGSAYGTYGSPEYWDGTSLKR